MAIAVKKTDDAPSLKPVCLFWFAKTYPHWQNLVAHLNRMGINALLVSSADELAEVSKNNPFVFSVFGDFEHLPELLKIRMGNVARTTINWFMIAPLLSSNLKDKIFKCGFSDVLLRPVHPFSFQNRCQVHLGRFVNQMHDKIEMEIPEWLQKARKNGTLRIIGNGEVKNNGKVKLIPGEHEIEAVRNKAFFLEESASKLSAYDLERVGKMLQAFQVLNDKKNHFSSTEDREEISAFYEEIESKQTLVTLWTKSQSFVSESSLMAYDSETGVIGLVPTRHSVEDLITSLKKYSTNSKIYLSAATLRGKIFASADVNALIKNKDHLSLKVDSTLHNVQRRQEFRHYFEANEIVFANIHYDNKVQQFKISDLSASGICVHGDKSLAYYLTSRKNEVKLSIHIGENEVQLTARLVFKSPGDEPKIAFNFLEPETVLTSKVRRFVYEQSFEYLNHFVLR